MIKPLTKKPDSLKHFISTVNENHENNQIWKYIIKAEILISDKDLIYTWQ